MNSSAAAQRRLAVVLATDVAGYSRMMSADEDGTVAFLNRNRDGFWLPKIAEHSGRLIDIAGDGMLIEFASAQNAVRFALELQEGMAERNRDRPDQKKMLLRVGIHLAEILFDEKRIYGDGVNIAARLEQIAEPGGINASDSVVREIDGKLPVEIVHKGETQLKNIPRPVKVFAIEPAGRLSKQPYFSVDRPAIAVLPFASRSADPEQAYFADGFTEDLIMELGRWRWLMVMARSSTAKYARQATDVRTIGSELGVRYVLEGSVRRTGNKLRIASELIDAATGIQLWSEHFDGAIDDMFNISDDIVAAVAAAIEPRLRFAEISRAKRKPTESLDAYDLYRRALHHRYALTAEDNLAALRLLRQAIDIDPNFAVALAQASNCIVVMHEQGWGDVGAEQIKEAIGLARRAIKAGPDDSVALQVAGFVLAGLGRSVDEALPLLERSLELNANDSEAWARAAIVHVYKGQYRPAIEYAERSLRLNPSSHINKGGYIGLAFAHLFEGRFEEALTWSERLTADPIYSTSSHGVALRVKIVALAHLGRLEEARAAAAALLQRAPGFRISAWEQRTPFRLEPQRRLFKRAFELAGLPS